MKQTNTVTVSLNRFSNQWNKPKDAGVALTMPHMTTPDMTMSLVELIEQFASGGTKNLGKAIYFDGKGNDTVIEDDLLLGRHWDSFDIIEKHEILADAKTDFARINQGIAEQQKNKADALAAQRKQKSEDNKKILAYLKKQDEKNGDK